MRCPDSSAPIIARGRNWPRYLPLVLLALILVGDTTTTLAFGPRRYHENEIVHGRASWYGAEQGTDTASGERFDPDALTAAHRHLPFGTILRVTNLNNGRSVDVRINDRGPWTGGSILDLSSAAADILKMKRDGTVPVEIQIMTLGTPGRYHRED
jgi:rare lipoprotein A